MKTSHIARYDRGPLTKPEKAQLFEENPKFQEMNEYPPDSVLSVRDEMQGKTAMSPSASHLLTRGAFSNLLKTAATHPPPSVVKVMEKMQGKTAATGNDPVWVVLDPTKDSEMGDILYATTVGKLPELVMGTGGGQWRKENTALYLKAAEAEKDAKARMAKRDKSKGKTAARTTHLAADKSGFTLCGERAYKDTLVDSVKDATCFYCKQAWDKTHGGHMASERLSIDMFADLLKDSKFERGEKVPVKDLPEELQDNVNNPPPAVKKLTEKLQGKQAGGVLAMDMFAEALKESKFEEGKPADPTENMSPDDAAEWERQTEEHKDEFKGASTPAQRSDNENNAVVENFFHKSADVSDLWVGWIEDPEGYMARFFPPSPRGSLKRQVMKVLNDVGLDLDWTMANAGAALRTTLDPDTVSPLWFSKLPNSDKGDLKGFLDMAPGRTASKVAATGLYGFNKMTEGACGAGVNKLQRVAKKIAASLYAKDEGSPAFLAKHAAKGGSKTASMLLKAMESIGPMAQINGKTAGKSGAGLYGFAEKTAKLGLTACNDLHHEAGVIAGDLFARKGADPVKVAGYLASHAKKAKCPYAAMLGECAPDIDTAVIANKKTATDFLASGEDEEEVEGNEEVLDIISKC